MSQRDGGYDPSEIEPRWQRKWQADELYRRTDRAQRPHYLLTMYPYPSGNLHIGHWYAMTPADARARYMRMRGHEVFFPIGFDAFGLPAENAAISRGVDPRAWTLANIDHMRGQIRSMGTMFDWSAEIVTCEPEYYRWNQWFFLKLLAAGLAYRRKAAVDYCPSCSTTLAREQVKGDDRVCERCSTPVVRRELEQWFLRITKYADELLEGLDGIDWPEQVKTMQRNWIGRSEGAEIDFELEGAGDRLSVFTTRPDTLYGVTALVLAPEHPLVDRLTTADRAPAVRAYQERAARSSEMDRLAVDREKTGTWTGAYCKHPLTGQQLPVWIADYVLMSYGTGAVMMVPGHDERDFEMAKEYDLPILEVIRPTGSRGGPLEAAHTGPGVMVNSGPCDGIVSTGKFPASEWNEALASQYDLPSKLAREGKQVVVEALEQLGMGRAAVTTRLRDWLISRQRYWGTPIPVVYCEQCGLVPVPESELPVVLPEGVAFLPTGESPLRLAEDWLNVSCPRCGGSARRDTDTMDTFVDSSWYQYRYLSPHYESAPFDPEVLNWLPVDQYTGGIEHATMHLLYTRFWTKAMRDLGLVPFDEPMLRLFNQGLILGEDSDKMSKSRGNVVDPDDLVARYGADAVRAYLMFIGPWDQGGPWDPRGVQGVVRWLADVWSLATAQAQGVSEPDAHRERDLQRATHQTLRRVTESFERFAFNTAVSTLMELRNTLKTARGDCVGSPAWAEAVDSMLLMMAPLVPHIAEELWSLRSRPYSVHQQPWPQFDLALAAEDTVEIAVQVRGKVRDRILLKVGATEAEAIHAALASEDVQRALDGAEPLRVIYVPGRLVNVVV